MKIINIGILAHVGEVKHERYHLLRYQPMLYGGALLFPALRLPGRKPVSYTHLPMNSSVRWPSGETPMHRLC